MTDKLDTPAGAMILNAVDETPRPESLLVPAPPGWEKVFAAARNEELGSTTWSNRFTLVSFWAFFFGPFYYFYKRMWMKGALLCALTPFILICEDLLKLAGIDIADGANMLLPLICMQYAYRDVYRRTTYNERVWPAFRLVGRWYFVVLILLVGIAVDVALNAVAGLRD